ncbi:MAG: cation:proton antiporter [Pseudomonadota bacterium]
MEPLTILLAFAAGLVFRRFGFPPLPGYLIAGFASHAFGLGEISIISAIADIGVILLLFTIGLKLQIRELAAPQIWAVTALHLLIAVPLTTVVIIMAGWLIPGLALDSTVSAWTLALALGFSSTVFAVKMFEDRGESSSLHANIAIGVLVIQDIIAVTYLVLAAEEPPHPAALLLFALPLLRPLLLRLLSAAGHGELLTLFGIGLALGAGELFELVHLKAGLGALIAGLLMANTAKSKELYNAMISLKDIFLIGFFLQVGYYGLPSLQMVMVATALSLLIFLRPLIYYFLFVGFRLRARTSLLASFALFNYSEFGLIVAAIAVTQGILPPEWLTTLALAISLSFFIATPFNASVHTIYNHFRRWLHRFERTRRLPIEAPADLGDASIVVLGMGRVGKGAYQYLQEVYPGQIAGVEENLGRVTQHQQDGYNCVHGDASDYDFWDIANLSSRQLILVSLTNHSENLTVVHLARQFNFANTLAVVSRYPDEAEELASLGCITFNLYGEAGHGFAEHVMEQIGKPG